jgi:phenylalanine-4-hydroxylase
MFLDWFTLEFGLVAQQKADGAGTEAKAYGAGLLSSFGELEWSTEKGIFLRPRNTFCHF